MKERISRRKFVLSSVAGVGAAVPLRLLASESGRLFAPVARSVAPPQHAAGPAVDGRDQALTALIAPIAVGTQLGSTRVDAIGVDERGLGVITLIDDGGRRWSAELASRTDQDVAHNPLELSNHYSVYLRNGGSGRTPTDEGVARAVRVIATRVRQNEDAPSAPLFVSRHALWAAAGYQPAAPTA